LLIAWPIAEFGWGLTTEYQCCNCLPDQVPVCKCLKILIAEQHSDLEQ